MHFDKIIMNPPYDRSLHLKILRKVLNKADEVVNLSPIRWLQDPLAEMKGKRADYGRFADVRERISELEVVSARKAQAMFGNVMNMDLGIYYLTKEGGWDSKSLLNSKAMKLLPKVLENSKELDINKKDGWRIRICTVGTGKSGGSGKRKVKLQTQKYIAFYNGMKDGRPWYDFFQKNQYSKTTPEITASIKFDTEEEANNFIQIMNSKLGLWFYNATISSVQIDEKNILWLPTYTHSWTDEQLYEYFGLTEEEVREIEQELQVMAGEV